jgi:hypothetical protein
VLLLEVLGPGIKGLDACKEVSTHLDVTAVLETTWWRRRAQGIAGWAAFLKPQPQSRADTSTPEQGRKKGECQGPPLLALTIDWAHRAEIIQLNLGPNAYCFFHLLHPLPQFPQEPPENGTPAVAVE